MDLCSVFFHDLPEIQGQQLGSQSKRCDWRDKFAYKEIKSVEEASDVADPLQQTIGLSLHCSKLQVEVKCDAIELI